MGAFHQHAAHGECVRRQQHRKATLAYEGLPTQRTPSGAIQNDLLIGPGKRDAGEQRVPRTQGIDFIQVVVRTSD